MNRKEFIKNTGLFIGGTLVIPSILASTEFIPSESEHVILINMGGGIRKQDVLGNQTINEIDDLKELNSIMPALFGGALPEELLNMRISEVGSNHQFPLIKNGLLFSNIETNSNNHRDSFQSLISIKDRISAQRHSIFSLLSNFKGFNKNQLWQVGGFKFEHNSLFNYIPAGSNDLETLRIAQNLIQEFKPKFININLQDADSGHSSYSSYCIANLKNSMAINEFWHKLQSVRSDMAQKTTLIVIPELGRNLNSNCISDQNGLFAYDHNDENSRKIWCLMLGAGVDSRFKNQVVSDSKNAHDVVPTIAQLFGVRDTIQRRFQLKNDFYGLLG